MKIGDNYFRPLDMGEVLRDVEGIKAARQNRMIRENVMKRQGQEDEALRGYLEGTVGPEAFAVMGGDRALTAYKTLNAMGESQREEAKRRNEELGQVSAAILNAPPEQQPSLYAQALGMLPPEVAERLPPEWGPEAQNAAKLGLSRAVALDKLFGAMTEKQQEQRQHTNKLAEIEAQGDKEIRVKKETGEGAEGIKSADSGNIARAVGQLFDSVTHPVTGEISFSSPTIAADALAVRTRAEQIFAAAKRAGQPIGHGEAAQRAFDEIKRRNGKNGGPGGKGEAGNGGDWKQTPSGGRYKVID